jgi:hypothetical protein
MNAPENSNVGFLGRNFKSCPSCGELINSDEMECRFCGTTIGEDGKPIHKHVDFKVSDKNHSVQPEPEPEPALLEESFTKDGKHIPSEYGPGFDPNKFCWPAFWFADLWHAEKGLLPQAMKNFWVRTFANGFGVAAVIILVAGSTTSTSLLTLGGIFAMLWFLCLIVAMVISYFDATHAHRRCLELCNKKPELYESELKKGSYHYWSILFVPFVIYLLAFTIMLSDLGNEEIVEEAFNKFDKLGNALSLFLH